MQNSCKNFYRKLCKNSAVPREMPSGVPLDFFERIASKTLSQEFLRDLFSKSSFTSLNSLKHLLEKFPKKLKKNPGRMPTRKIPKDTRRQISKGTSRGISEIHLRETLGKLSKETKKKLLQKFLKELLDKFLKEFLENLMNKPLEKLPRMY